jgi:uroporphyrinogen-III synthase
MTRVIVTRPEREALRWVRDLSALGFDAQCLPLIEIKGTAQQAELTRAWEQIDAYVALMFVSGNAVAHFFTASGARSSVFAASAAGKTRAWATGPGTARALLRAGVAPERLDAPPADAGQFDSEALWLQVASQVQAGVRVLIVRGADATPAASDGQGSGRDWFAHQVQAAGAQADFVASYERRAPQFSAAERDLARQAARDGSAWLFSSAQAVANLNASLPGQDWAGAWALATHPRIAEAARQAGFSVVFESRPTLADVAAALKQHFKTLK